MPSYTISLIGCIVNMLGFTSTLSFGPKYMEKQFNIPAWEANIILGNKVRFILNKPLHMYFCLVLLINPMLMDNDLLHVRTRSLCLWIKCPLF